MKFKKMMIVPLILGASMIVTGCNNGTNVDNNDNTSQVENKELKAAIDSKIKPLIALKEAASSDKYTKESIENYCVEIDQIISEIKSLKTVKEVNDYEVEISSVLSEKVVYTKISSITEPLNEEITIKGEVIANHYPRKIMIDDGTGRIVVFSAKPINFSNINYKQGDSVTVTGTVAKSRTTGTLQFVVEDGATVALYKEDLSVESTPTKYNGEQFNALAAQLCGVEEFTPTSYEYHPHVSFVGKLTRSKEPNKEVYHYNFAVEGLNKQYVVSVNPNSVLEYDFNNGDGLTYEVTGYVDEIVKNRYINVFGCSAKLSR